MNNQGELNNQLIYAIQIGNLNLVRNLINCGADINARNKWDKTTMDIAKICGHSEIIKYLKDVGFKNTDYQRFTTKR